MSKSFIQISWGQKAKLDTEAPSWRNQALEKQVKRIHVGFVVSPDQPWSGAKHAGVTAWHPGAFPCLQRLLWLRRGAVALGRSMLTQEQTPGLPGAGTGAPGAVLYLSCIPRFWAGWYKPFTMTDYWSSSFSVVLLFLLSLFSAAAPALSFAAVSPAALSGFPSRSTSVRSVRKGQGAIGHELLTGLWGLHSCRGQGLGPPGELPFKGCLQAWDTLTVPFWSYTRCLPKLGTAKSYSWHPLVGLQRTYINTLSGWGTGDLWVYAASMFSPVLWLLGSHVATKLYFKIYIFMVVV